MRNSCRLLSVLLLIATGCTYTPVRYDPSTGYQVGGGVGVMCGGPLDPWMMHCGSQCGCYGPCDCIRGFFCNLFGCNPCWTSCLNPCAPACPPNPCATPICPPNPCATPICPPTNICPPTPCATPIYAPTNVCPPSCGVPLGSSPYTPLPTLPGGAPVTPAPLTAPQSFGQPMPTFAEPCENCAAPHGGSTYYSPSVQGALPAATNYPRLFTSPPTAPPPSSDAFMMPTPMAENEIPPASEQLPPHYGNMETPGSGESAGAMNPNAPMPQITPRQMPPQQNPQPTPAEVNQSSFRQVMPASVTQQGVVQPALKHYDSRRQQWVPLRL